MRLLNKKRKEKIEVKNPANFGLNKKLEKKFLK